MKPHPSHDWSDGPKCVRCGEYVLSLDAKWPCKPAADAVEKPVPHWDVDDSDVWVTF